jgi:hypothetical protein
MVDQIYGAWDEYAHEQREARARELHNPGDLSGEAALDFIVNAIEAGQAFTREDVVRSRQTAARRERARLALIGRFGPSIESELRFCVAHDPETASIIAEMVTLQAPTLSKIILLDAQGFTSPEISVRVCMSPEAVRKRMSRFEKALAEQN